MVYTTHNLNEQVRKILAVHTPIHVATGRLDLRNYLKWKKNDGSGSLFIW